MIKFWHSTPSSRACAVKKRKFNFLMFGVFFMVVAHCMYTVMEDEGRDPNSLSLPELCEHKQASQSPAARSISSFSSESNPP
jgi:hypothetical protein